MKKLLAILALLISTSSFAEDSWTGPDKQMHFAGSFMFGFIAGAVFPDEPLWVRYAAGMAPGIAKELTDIGGSGFSYKDLVADFLGVVAGEYTGGFMVRIGSNDSIKITYQTKF